MTNLAIEPKLAAGVATRRGAGGSAPRRRIARATLVLAPLAAAMIALPYVWQNEAFTDRWPSRLLGSSGSVAVAQDAALFEVRRGTFAVKVSEIGELRALDSVTVSAAIDTPVIFLVPEGASVKKGDVLVRLDGARYEAELEDAKAQLAVAQADHQRARTEVQAQQERLLADISRFEAEVRLANLNLQEFKKKPLPQDLEMARLGLEKSQVAFDNATKQSALLPELLEKGYVTRDKLEEAQFRYAETKMNLQVAQFSLQTVQAGATPQELEQANIRLEQSRVALEKARQAMHSELKGWETAVTRADANVVRAKALIDRADARFRRAELPAPRDGIVVYAPTQKGEKIQLGMIPFQGQALIYLPDLATMVVDCEINEFDIGRIKIGGPVEVRPEAYPGVAFRGKVAKIGSIARRKQGSGGTASGTKIFEVTVKIEEFDERLRPGLTASVDVIIDRREDVLSVPLASVFAVGDEQKILVAAGGRVEERKVVLGPRNEHSVVVSEGLRPGDKVLLDRPQAR